jgi:hypothetical protein
MAQDIENKKTTLDDDAAIYKHNTDRDEKNSPIRKFSELKGEEKKQYFKDYIMKPLIIGVIVVVFAIYFIVTSLTDSKTYKFYLACVNPYYMDNDAMQAHVDYLADYWNLEGHEVAVYDSDITLNDSSGLSTFVTYLNAGTIDVVIGTKDELSSYGRLFIDLNELEEEYKSLIPEEALCDFTYTYTSSKTGEDEEATTTCGIYLKYTIFADNIRTDISEENADNLVIAIASAGLSDTDGSEYKADFLKYMFGGEAALEN